MRRAPFQTVECEATESFAPGVQAKDFEPGDFILTHGDAWTSRLIRFGQRLRFRDEDRKYAYWNHAALITTPEGDIVEAIGSGVEAKHISHYKEREYTLVRILANDADRQQVRAFGFWAAGYGGSPRKMSYGKLMIISIGYTLITGGKFTFGMEGQMICSGLVARAMERTWAIFNRTPSHIMPADLAKYYGVEPPGTSHSSEATPAN